MKRIFVSTLFSMVIIADASGSDTTVHAVQKSATAYISEFRRGIDFRTENPLSGVLRNGKIDKSDLAALSKELRHGTHDVRENVVRLLAAVALKLDAVDPQKIPVVRDRDIIRTLLTDGFAKEDNARQLAESILLRKCKPADLAAFNEIYLESFRSGNSSYLQIVAKAKTLAARPYVDMLAKDPFWSEDPDNLELIDITKAALGDNVAEDKFISAVYKADKEAPPAPKNTMYDVGNGRDGKEVARRLPALGFIGTRETLSVACKYLRSDLKSYRGNGEKSVRYSALDAIRYNYPDERILRKPETRAEWQVAEQFCTKHIGVIFDGPTQDSPADVVIPTFG